MPYTKKDIIELAFEELGLANYNFDIQPEQYQSALKRLDSMMGTWNSKGIRIGYPLSSSPTGSNLEDSTELSDMYIEAVYSNLAVKIAPMFGKNPSVLTLKNSHESYKNILRDTSEIIPMQYDRTVRGAGNKPYAVAGVFLETANTNIDTKDNILDF